MNADDLTIFVDGVANYFSQTTASEAQVGTPFLSRDVNSYIYDYTGVIGISGEEKGSIFFSATKPLLSHVLHEMGLISTRDSNVLDLVGEICNTLSGNARRKFGQNFNISTPIAIQGKPEKIQTSDVASVFVIPIEWSNQRANLIVNLEEK